MRKLTAVFAVFLFILMSAPLFAEEGETEAHPSSPFNIVNGWFTNLGKKADGTWMWKVESEKSPLTADEIKERRGKVGAGMRVR